MTCQRPVTGWGSTWSSTFRVVSGGAVSDRAGIATHSSTAGVDLQAPFGGTKASSFGPREQGPYAREFYTRMKTAYVQA